MKVRDIMAKAPVFCHPDSNLASATEKMWVHNCGMLPVVDDQLGVMGVITDRDVCMALGTRNKKASDVLVRELMSGMLFTCAPEDDIHSALEEMKKGHVRRLPVLNREGKLVGVLTMDDIILASEEGNGKRKPELAGREVVDAFKGIRSKRTPVLVGT